jgi:hypothetical protein
VIILTGVMGMVDFTGCSVACPLVDGHQRSCSIFPRLNLNIYLFIFRSTKVVSFQDLISYFFVIISHLHQPSAAAVL